MPERGTICLGLATAMRGIEQIPWLYDASMAVFEATGLGRWRRRLLRGVVGPALEVGCGTGRNLALYPDGVRVVASEPTIALLVAARRKAPRAPLVAARAEALPFRDGGFATVVSSLVFCSVADPPGALAEVRRVLRPGGIVRMLEHVRHHRRALAGLQDAVQPLWTTLTGGCHPNRDTEAAVEAAGFTIDADTRRRRGVMRLFAARADAGGPAGPR